MELVKVIHKGKPTLINGDFIISINFEERSKKLELKFSNGDSLMFSGNEASDAWNAFSNEVINDEHEHDLSDFAAEEEEEERDPFTRINREIAELENQIKRKIITRSWEGQRLRHAADSLGEYWDSKKKRQYADDVTLP